MPIESSVTIISDLNATYPANSDAKAIGANHIRNVKTALLSLNTASSTQGGAQVGFIQGGTGAVARNAQDKARDIVSAGDFMTSGQRSDVAARTLLQDVTTAVSNAATALGTAGGGRVWLGVGSLLVSSAMALPANTGLVGAGKGATVISTNSTTADIVQIANTNCEVRSLTLDTSVAKSAGSHISITSGGGYANVEDVYINKAFRGISCAATIVHVTRVDIRETVATTGMGVLITGGNDHFLTRVVMDTTGTEPAAGLKITASGGTWLKDCDIIHSRYGLLVAPGAGQEVDWIFADNSAFDTNQVNGISLDTTAGATAIIKGGQFTACWTSSNGVQGLITQGAALSTLGGIYLLGHRAFSNGHEGMNISYGTDIHIVSPFVGGNSTSSVGTYNGIGIGQNVTGWHIHGGRVGSQAALGDTHQYNIWTDTTTNHFSILGVDVRGGVLGTILINTTGTDRIVSKNLGYNPIALTSISVTASPFTYTNNTGDTVTAYVTGGTVSSVTASGKQVAAATNTAVTLPQGQAAIVTYSVAPTMSFVGH